MVSGLDEIVALDENGTRIADFELLDLTDADNEIFQVGLRDRRLHISKALRLLFPVYDIRFLTHAY